MSSQRRINSSRANGAKSRGPKTPEGKHNSSLNNLRHGLLAGTVVLEPENTEVFSRLLAVFEHELNPQTEVERELVETMAVARWRILRLWAMERSTLKTEMERDSVPSPATPPRAPPRPSARSPITPPASSISTTATKPASIANMRALSVCSKKAAGPW